jgi:hypothetical protein
MLSHQLTSWTVIANVDEEVEDRCGSCVMCDGATLVLVVRPFCREGRAGTASSCYDMGADTEHVNMLKKNDVL